jgi:acyl dehydratase
VTPQAPPTAASGASPGRFVRVGERFERTVTLDAESVRAFARQIGDTNPLHHDAVLAAGTRFGGLIACGPHTSSLLMAVTADAFAQRGAALGLDFRMQFRRAVPASETLLLAWTVTAVSWKASLGGELVSLDGSATGPAGTLYVSAQGLVLVKETW